MEQAARVTRITEYGDARMREAIARGLVSGDLKTDVERALRDNEVVRRDNEMLQRRNLELEAIRREYAKRHIASYDARLREKGLWMDIKGLITVAAIITAMACIAVGSVVLWVAGL